MPARIEDVWWDGDVLRLSGHAYIAFQELPTERSGRIRLTLEESGHPDSVIPLKVRRVRRPDVTETARDGVTNYDGSGWEAEIPVSALRHRGRFRTGNWRLRLEVRAKGVTRRRWLSGTDPGRGKRPGWRTVDGARIVPTTQAGNFGVEISTTPAEVEDIRVDGMVLELTGTLHGRRFDPADASMRAARDDGTSSLELPVATGGSPSDGGTPFVARVDLRTLGGDDEVDETLAHGRDLGDGDVWNLSMLPEASGARIPALGRQRDAPAATHPRWQRGPAPGHPDGSAAGHRPAPPPRGRGVSWSDDGTLELTGRYAEASGADDRAGAQRHRPGGLARRADDPGRRRLHRAAEADVDGDTRRADGARRGPVGLLLPPQPAAAAPVRVKVARQTLPALPQKTVDGARELMAYDVDHDCLALLVSGDLPVGDRGRGGQRRLRTQDYPSYLRQPLREQVLVDAYGTGRHGDDARALHDELLSRDTRPRGRLGRARRAGRAP